MLKTFMIPGEAVDLYQGYYHGVYVLLNFNKEDNIEGLYASYVETRRSEERRVSTYEA